MRFFLFFCFLSCSIWKMDAAVYGSDTLRCRICFPVGSSVVDLSYGENGSRLDAFVAGIHARQATAVLCRLSLHSGASPEGGLTFNRRLSDKRLASFRSILQERIYNRLFGGGLGGLNLSCRGIGYALSGGSVAYPSQYPCMGDP